MAGRLPAWALIFLLASLVAAQNAPTTMDMDDDGVDDDGVDDDDDSLTATNCTRVNPRVGLRAAFMDFEDKNIGGVVAIRDDCSIVVRGFTYDGSGEDTVLVGAGTKEDLGNGNVFRTLATGKAWDGSEIVEIFLDDGLSWSDINFISCWDRQLSVDFGSVDLTTGFFPDDVFDYDDDFNFGDDDGDVDDDGVLDADDPDFDDDGDIDDDGVPNLDDPDFNDDDGDVDDDGVLNIDDPDFKDDDGDVDDDGVTDIDDDGLVDDDGDVDDDGVLDDDGDVDDDGVPDMDDDGDVDDDGVPDAAGVVATDDGVDDDGVADDDVDDA